MRFPYSLANKFTSFNTSQYIISLITLLGVSVTPGIVTTTIGSTAEVNS